MSIRSGVGKTIPNALTLSAIWCCHARVIVVNGADVGRLDVEDRGDELLLALIEIAAEHRCRGIGGRLIQTLLNDAFAEGRRVRLSVLQVNTRACQLYRRLGFTEVVREGVGPGTRIRDGGAVRRTHAAGD